MFQVDSGASINILPEKYIGDNKLAKTDKKLVMWNGTEVWPKGMTRLVVKKPKNKKIYSVEFVVVSEDLRPLIGARAAQHMGLITINKEKFNPVPASTNGKEASINQVTTQEILSKYADVFEREVGNFPGTVSLEVDPTVKPVITPVRRIPTALKDEFKKELDRMTDLRVMAPISKRTPG